MLSLYLEMLILLLGAFLIGSAVAWLLVTVLVRKPESVRAKADKTPKAAKPQSKKPESKKPAKSGSAKTGFLSRRSTRQAVGS
ncbi:MAG: hypothetical protein HZY75_11135 [Nocardioidaceae bacterium]|nr:MAG: hypothetical protein HZY75_11135 [Nocardioidaceae bacterium]